MALMARMGFLVAGSTSETLNPSPTRRKPRARMFPASVFGRVARMQPLTLNSGVKPWSLAFRNSEVNPTLKTLPDLLRLVSLLPSPPEIRHSQVCNALGAWLGSGFETELQVGKFGLRIGL